MWRILTGLLIPALLCAAESVSSDLTAIAKPVDAAQNERKPRPKLQQASNFAASTDLSAPDVKHMQMLLAGDGQVREAGQFVANWIAQSRKLPAAQAAAGLYSADILLESIPASSQLQLHFASTAAQFDHDQLGGVDSYAHNLLWEALHIAPESAAGQQAFLDLLDAAFHPECCYSGNGFEEVIKRAPQYLTEHPGVAIRSQILLAIGDAYRDRIATANGANGDPFNDAAKYKKAIRQSHREALLNYRAAIKASPGSDSANRAQQQAWSLQAGQPPLDTRFVRLYD